MKTTIFDFRDYKRYLVALGESESRGYRKNLAEAAGCQTAYVSHVLNGGAHFSWEQAEAISRFLGHSAMEMEYFLFVVELTRAGTPSLRRFLSAKLDEIREKHLNIKTRVLIKETLSREDQARYYSAWYYAAIHIMLMLPKLQTQEALCRHLRLSPKIVSSVLEFLCSVSLAVRKGQNFGIGSAELHLETDSPMISKHHTNWRLQAIRSLENFREGDLHYSAVFAIHPDDAIRIRANLVEQIQNANQIARESKEEVSFAMGVDLWEI
jgi:uncharacterized protein (TIGR02147 family)